MGVMVRQGATAGHRLAFGAVIAGITGMALMLGACGRDNSEPASSPPAESAARPVKSAPASAEPAVPVPVASSPVPEYPTRALFGDTHVHTGWSADAGMDGAILTSDDAYRFALGEEITSNTGQRARLARPFDWFMVTDHSDGMGTISEIVAGNPELMANPVLKGWSEALKGTEEQAAAAQERTHCDAVRGASAG